MESMVKNAQMRKQKIDKFAVKGDVKQREEDEGDWKGIADKRLRKVNWTKIFSH